MATQKIVWTALPFGFAGKPGTRAGKRRVSIVVSPRLTPGTSHEQVLEAFKEWLDWPAALKTAKFAIESGGKTIPLVLTSKPDSALWRKLFNAQTPVAGFVYKDMSKVNLRSYSGRNMLGYVKRHYGRLAVQSASNLPSLLPWKDAHPDLKTMVSEAGTRTVKFQTGRETL